MGQSNMVGFSGPIDGVLDAPNGLIQQWGRTSPNDNQVILAQNPLQHVTINSNTIGLAMTFAKEYLGELQSDRQILLVPCGANDTGFSNNHWNPGDTTYEAAVTRTNAALASHSGNVLRAILWHQGERDYLWTQSQYETAIDAMLADFRSRVTGAQTAPFICGETLIGGTFTTAAITAALAGTPNREDYAAYVASTGLVSNGDNIHFDAASLRTLGERYYDALGDARNNHD